MPPDFSQDAHLDGSAGAICALLEPVFRRLAGEGAAPASMSVDFGPNPDWSGQVTLEAKVERATRTLVFLHGAVLVADTRDRVATAWAVFRRGPIS